MPFPFGELAAQNRQELARLQVEAARSKLKVLEGFERRQRTGELKAEREKARADELAAKATLELEAVKLNKLQRGGKVANLPAEDRQILALLDRAIPIEAQLREKLGAVSGSGHAGEPVPNEIGGLISELHSLINRAQNLEDGTRGEPLEKRVRQASQKG